MPFCSLSYKSLSSTIFFSALDEFYTNFVLPTLQRSWMLYYILVRRVHGNTKRRFEGAKVVLIIDIFWVFMVLYAVAEHAK
jgi:hypothetical protein